MFAVACVTFGTAAFIGGVMGFSATSVTFIGIMVVIWGFFATGLVRGD
jgi:hypothetical protein